jgi:hypothetical protein
LDDGLEEASKDVQAIALADFAETRMIGQRLIQIVPEIPSDAQSICHLAHEQALRPYIFKEHHQLQFEEHYRINRWSSSTCVALANQFVHKREIQDSLQMAVKMILGNQFLQGYGDQWGERPLF